MHHRRAALAAGLLLVASLPTTSGARSPATDPGDLWLGYGPGPYLQPGPLLPGAAPVRWEVVDPRTLADGRLAITVRVMAPTIDLPLVPGPALLLGSLALHGGAGGDVGLEHTFPTIARAVLPPCRIATACAYEGRLVLRTDRIGAYLRRPIQGRWSAVHVGLTLIRTFDHGRWVQSLPLWGRDDALRMAKVGRLGAPRPFRGISVGTGLLSRAQVRRWDRAGGYRRDRAGLLDITERARRRMGDESTRTPSVPVRLSLDPSDCPRGMTLSSPGGAIAFDRSSGGRVDRTVRLPAGSAWRLTVPSLDRIQIPADDTLLTFGPFIVGGSSARIVGAWGCVGPPSGDVTCLGCAASGPKPTPDESAASVLDPTGPPPLGRTPSTPTGLAWREAQAPFDREDVGIVDVTAHGEGFAALGMPGSFSDHPGAARVWLSDTGAAWHQSAESFPGVDGTRASLDRIVAVAGRLVAVGHDGSRLMTWSSADGDSWRRAPDDPSLDATHRHDTGIRPGLVIDGVAASADGRLLVVGHAPYGRSGVARRVWASDDGRSWERLATEGLGPGVIRDVAVSPSGFLAVTCCTDAADGAPRLLTSTDGSDWQLVGVLPVGVDRVLWDAPVGKYVAAGRLSLPDGLEAAAVWTSVDGVAWHMSVRTQWAGMIDMTLLAAGRTLVLATPGFDSDMGWSWWSALVSVDGGDTWQASAGWPVQGEGICPAVGAAGHGALVLSGCGRAALGIAPTAGGP